VASLHFADFDIAGVSRRGAADYRAACVRALAALTRGAA
jgi:hypothetical protein